MSDVVIPETVVAPIKQDDNAEPNWLPARLARHEKTLVKGLGVDSADEARALIDEARKLKAEKLSGEEKMRAEIDALKPWETRARSLEVVVKSRAEYELAALSQQQRDAVLRIAGDDYGKQLDMVATLRPTWTQGAPPTQEAVKAVAAPATTIATVSAPEATPSHTENHKATWEALKKENPFHAAAYLSQYQRQIFPA